MNRSTQEWVDHFRWNGSVAMRVPWHIGPDLSDEERAAIAHSIQMFQLGENSEGRHLMRYAKEWADRTGDAAYPEAIRMLIVEEQRHAGVLGRFMEINGIARIKRGCTDGIFRRARNMFGSLEISISVLVTAEIIAKIYYPALSKATASIVLRDNLRADSCARKSRTWSSKPSNWRASGPDARHTASGRRAFFTACSSIRPSWSLDCRIGSRLRRGGLSLWQFFSRCHREFVRDLAAMEPQRTSRRSKRRAGQIAADSEDISSRSARTSQKRAAARIKL